MAGIKYQEPGRMKEGPSLGDAPPCEIQTMIQGRDNQPVVLKKVHSQSKEA
jgi:hypothetical protein